MADYFTNVLNQAVNQGVETSKVDDARKWFSTQTTGVKRVEPRTVVQRSADALVNKILIGRMYLFMYDAATKDKLPYFDRFPLIFPFRIIPGGFYGINMHYLPYMLRARLMDSLYDVINNDKMDITTKLRISYNVLN